LVSIHSNDFFFPMPRKDLASPRHTVQSMVGQRFCALNPRTTTLPTPSPQQDRADVPAAHPKHLPHPTQIFVTGSSMVAGLTWPCPHCPEPPVSPHAKPSLQFRGGHVMLTQRAWCNVPVSGDTIAFPAEHPSYRPLSHAFLAGSPAKGYGNLPNGIRQGNQLRLEQLAVTFGVIASIRLDRWRPARRDRDFWLPRPLSLSAPPVPCLLSPRLCPWPAGFVSASSLVPALGRALQGSKSLLSSICSWGPDEMLSLSLGGSRSCV